MMAVCQVDEGAVKHVLGGANVMAPGLTSKGGNLPENLQVGDIVVLKAR